MPAPRNDALSRFVLSPTKATNGKGLDQQWNDLARFMRGPGSALARWLAIGQMHLVYKAMKQQKSGDPVRLENLTMRHFVERAITATGVSRPTIYRYVERSHALVERLGPPTLKTMLSGEQPIANDEDMLLTVAQLPTEKALKVADVYMRGKGAAAARLAEKYLHEHRLSGLTTTHEPKLRGGSLVNGANTAEPGKLDARNVVFFGDALVHLKESIRPESVQTCITSPPFYGQRDFGTRHWFGGDPLCRHDRKVAHGSFREGDVAHAKYRTSAASESGHNAITHSCSKCGAWHGQLGQEPDVDTYIAHVVTAFREVRRVLREDGVCWIEIGDGYNAGTNAPSPDSGGTDVGSWQSRSRTGRRRCDVPGLPAKSLLLVPQRLAIALQEDGWTVRAEVIFHKLTALPESVTDRPTRSHTTILMLARSENYYYDHVAIMEPTTGGAKPSDASAGAKEAKPGSGNRANRSFHHAVGGVVSMRNIRDVWSFRAGRFPHAHMATFPPGLPERCILASTSEKGACARCGAPWARKTVQSAVGGKVRVDGSVVPDAIPPPETIGWEPTCACGVTETVPCVVLDPFAGSGTTLMVAKQLNRDYIGIEINEREYRPLIERRLRQVGVRPLEKVARPSSGSRARRA